MSMTSYEMVVGLEVHIELKTATKIFCSCKSAFGDAPNTHCCPVCLGYPGALPVLNRAVLDYAIKAGLATDCTIARRTKQDRKNYFYPDLPKAYQISQYDLPLCYDGFVTVDLPKGEKKVGITRIHIEEDAGKLIHDRQAGTFIDYNRAGVPLIEIVSEPDIRSPEEAVAYLKKLRTIMLYIGVSDCKMQEGSMRCDVNLSVRPVGDTSLGTRTEIKNINSFNFVAKAISYEFERQTKVLQSGGTVLRETRRFDEASGKTLPMRTKEEADDYRFFPDPDLAPIEIDEDMIAGLANEIPELPHSRQKRYAAYGLSSEEIQIIVAERRFADFFDAVCPLTPYPQKAAALLVSEALTIPLPEYAPPPVSPAHFAELTTLYGDGTVNLGTAKKLLAEIWTNDQSPLALVKARSLAQINDEGLIRELILAAIKENPLGIEDFRRGKKKAIKVYVGAVMANTRGLANPTIINKVLSEITNE